MHPIGWYFAFDWAIMLRLAKRGRFARLNLGWMERGAKGLSSRKDIMSSCRTKPIHWIFPLWELSKVVARLFREEAVLAKLSIFRALVRLNYFAAREQIRQERRKCLRYIGYSAVKIA